MTEREGLRCNFMPEHFHLLLQASEKVDPSRIVQSLKTRTAIFVLKHLQENQALPWCARMLAEVTLPATVHFAGPHRVWQRRFYDFNVWSEKKRLEKLAHMHGNPVKRRLVDSPEKWAYSSFRYYALGDASVLRMDQLG